MTPVASDLLAALAGSALVLAVPGPTNALLAAAGAGARRDGPALIGAVVAGYAASIAVLRLAGAPMLAALPELAPVVRLALAVWLVHLGCCLWRRPPAGQAVGVGPRGVFLATLLNPKGAVFAFALWPTAAVADPGRLAAWAAGLAITIVAVSTLWFTAGRRLAALGPGAGLFVARLAAVLLAVFATTLGASALATVFRPT